MVDFETTGVSLGLKLSIDVDGRFVSATTTTRLFSVLRAWLVPLSWHPVIVTVATSRINFAGKHKVESSLINGSDS